MTVTQRKSPGEVDIVSLPGHKLLRYDDFLFPWRAEHKVNGVCNFSAVFMTEAEAKHADATHPHKTNYEPLASMHVAETMWLDLDRVVAALMEKKHLDDASKLKDQGRCGGLAYAIRNASNPEFYPNEQAVSKEAARRYKQSKGEVPWAPTPGYLYNPLRPRPEAATSAPRAAKAAQPAPRPAGFKPATPETVLAAKAAAVPEETKTAIRTALESGIFQPANLVGLYSLPVEVVEYIGKSS